MEHIGALMMDELKDLFIHMVRWPSAATMWVDDPIKVKGKTKAIEFFWNPFSLRQALLWITQLQYLDSYHLLQTLEQC